MDTKIILNINAFVAGSPYFMYTIRLECVDHDTNSHLENVQIFFTIIHYDESQKQINYEFLGVSDNMGLVNTNFLVTKGSLYVATFVAKKENYWNYHQLD